MNFDGFKSVKQLPYTFVVNDFNSITSISQGFYPKKGKLVPAYIVCETGELKNGLTCVKAYDVGFKIYYCSDGKLYREKDGGIKAFGLPAMPSAPNVFTCVYGVKTTLPSPAQTELIFLMTICLSYQFRKEPLMKLLKEDYLSQKGIK